MINFIKALYEVLCNLRYAGHAANLARNGKYKEAQSMYKD